MRPNSWRLCSVGSALLICGAAQAATVLPQPPCVGKEVRYSAVDPETWVRSIVLTRLHGRPERIPEPTSSRLIQDSPQGMAAFNRVLIADVASTKRRDEVMQIYTVIGKPKGWEIKTFDVGDSAELVWWNEDLLFIRIWWESWRSTDLVFQISIGTFIYAKEAAYTDKPSPCP